MGDKEYYVCLKCSVVASLEAYEALKWLENHWGHLVVRLYHDTGDRLTAIPFQSEEAGGL